MHGPRVLSIGSEPLGQELVPVGVPVAAGGPQGGNHDGALLGHKVRSLRPCTTTHASATSATTSTREGFRNESKRVTAVGVGRVQGCKCRDGAAQCSREGKASVPSPMHANSHPPPAPACNLALLLARWRGTHQRNVLGSYLGHHHGWWTVTQDLGNHLAHHTGRAARVWTTAWRRAPTCTHTGDSNYALPRHTRHHGTHTSTRAPTAHTQSRMRHGRQVQRARTKEQAPRMREVEARARRLAPGACSSSPPAGRTSRARRWVAAVEAQGAGQKGHCYLTQFPIPLEKALRPLPHGCKLGTLPQEVSIHARVIVPCTQPSVSYTT
jgi:hypothetical protein